MIEIKKEEKRQKRNIKYKNSLQLAVGKKTRYKKQKPNQGGFGLRQDGQLKLINTYRSCRTGPSGRPTKVTKYVQVLPDRPVRTAN